MLYAIISDIHANTDALDRVLADARACGAESVVCLGDIVGYGPSPAEAVERVRASCTVAVAGNHDDAVSGRGDASCFNDLAGEAASRHRDALGRRERAWLASLPYASEIEGAVVVHGDLVAPEEFRYVETEDDARCNFAASGAQLAFVGHTHVPALFLTGESGAVYAAGPQDFEMEEGKRYIVNPGSVGYPRENDGKCLSSYVLYDSTARTVCFRYLAFSVASVMQRGARARGRRAAFAALFAAAAVAAALAIAMRGAPNRADAGGTPPGAAETAPGSAATAAETRRLVNLEGAKTLRANLSLEKGSLPAKLTVCFTDPAGAVVSVETSTVKKSSRREFAVPGGAVAAELTATGLEPGQTPRIASFEPSKSP